MQRDSGHQLPNPEVTAEARRHDNLVDNLWSSYILSVNPMDVLVKHREDSQQSPWWFLSSDLSGRCWYGGSASLGSQGPYQHDTSQEEDAWRGEDVIANIGGRFSAAFYL